MENSIDVNEKNYKYTQMLDHLIDNRFNMKKDMDSELVRFLSDTQIPYLYIEMALQCKFTNEVNIAEQLGRPSFLWSDEQIIAKLKRKHTAKTVPTYLKRLEIILQLGLIKKIPFEEMEPNLLQMIDETKRKQRPNLYVMVEVTPSMIRSIPYQDIDFDTINSKMILQKEKETKMQKLQEEKEERKKNKYAKSSTKKITTPKDHVSFDVEPTKLKKKPTFIELPKVEQYQREDQIQTRTEWLDEMQVLKYNQPAIDKLNDLTNNNIAVMNSIKFLDKYPVLANYLKEQNLHTLYLEILKYNVDFVPKKYLEYKKKPVFFLDKETIASLYNNVNNQRITSREANKLLDLLCEIGMLKKITHQELATEFQMKNKDLVSFIIRNSYNNFSSSSKLYILLRLSDTLLTKVSNHVTQISSAKNSHPIEEKNIKLESKQTQASQLSIADCAIEILSNYTVDGDKVIVEKSAFDKLIQAVLRHTQQ